MVSFTNAPKHFGTDASNSGHKKQTFRPHFSRLPHLTPHISGTKRHIDKPKCYCQSTVFPLQVDPLSVTFDPATAEIRSLILTHPIGGHYVTIIIVGLPLTTLMVTLTNHQCSIGPPTEPHEASIEQHTLGNSLPFSIPPRVGG